MDGSKALRAGVERVFGNRVGIPHSPVVIFLAVLRQVLPHIPPLVYLASLRGDRDEKGHAIGLLLALAVTRLFRVILLGVSPSDPLPFSAKPESVSSGG